MLPSECHKARHCCLHSSGCFFLRSPSTALLDPAQVPASTAQETGCSSRSFSTSPLPRHQEGSELGTAAHIKSFHPTLLNLLPAVEARHYLGPNITSTIPSTSPFSLHLLSTIFSKDTWTPQPSIPALTAPVPIFSPSSVPVLHPEEPSLTSENIFSKVYASHASRQLGLMSPYPSAHRAVTSTGERRFKERKGRIHSLLLIPTKGPSCFSTLLPTLSQAAPLCYTAPSAPAEVNIPFIKLAVPGPKPSPENVIKQITCQRTRLGSTEVDKPSRNCLLF